MMTTEEAHAQLQSNPDFVNLKRYGYSLTAVMEQFPNGCPDKLIAQALLITEDDVKALDEGITAKLRSAMKVDDV
jgi:hypothetical protein